MLDASSIGPSVRGRRASQANGTSAAAKPTHGGVFTPIRASSDGTLSASVRCG